MRQGIIHHCNVAAEAVENPAKRSPVEELHGSTQDRAQKTVVLDFAGTESCQDADGVSDRGTKSWNGIKDQIKTMRSRTITDILFNKRPVVLDPQLKLVLLHVLLFVVI